MRAPLLAFLLAAQPAPAQDVAVSLRLPNEEKVVFRGVANFDGAGGNAAQVLYPAPSIAGALAALVTHGLLVDSTRRGKEDGIQKAADGVLAPHRETIDKLTCRELLVGAASRMNSPGPKMVIGAGEKPASGLVLDSAPVFSMTQDGQAIVVDNPIAVRRPGDAEDKAFAAMVRVVSAPEDAAPWSDEGGKLLKERSAALLAESFDIALRAMGQPPRADAPFRTVRYRQGKDEAIERAQVLAERCDRLLLRNLRGWLMSVPVLCEPPAATAEPHLAPPSAAK